MRHHHLLVVDGNPHHDRGLGPEGEIIQRHVIAAQKFLTSIRMSGVQALQIPHTASVISRRLFPTTVRFLFRRGLLACCCSTALASSRSCFASANLACAFPYWRSRSSISLIAKAMIALSQLRRIDTPSSLVSWGQLRLAKMKNLVSASGEG